MTEQYHKSPIEALGYTGWKQVGIFRSHLMLPIPYLRVIVKNYRDLAEVPVLLPRLVEHIDKHIWSTMNDKERHEALYKAKGVPVPYLRDDSTPIAGVRTIQAYEAITEDPEKFLARPVVLYLHSGFENGALKAASNITKAALQKNVDARMIGFGALLKEIKTWETNTEILKKTEKAQLLCLYMVGKEFATDFTRSVLEELISSRRVQGKTTLISTHLEPDEFRKRYGFDPQAVPLKFEDDKITTTVNELLAYMKK